MAVPHRRGRRAAFVATAAAVFALTAGLLTGCEFDDSVDCVANADDITDSITAINRAGADAVGDPSRTGDSVDAIERNLDRIHDWAAESDADAGKVDHAVDDLRQAVEDYNRDVLAGGRPDSAGIDRAASELRDLCTS
ncbi:hypothetical protein [Streptomyces sp. NPDC005476]|uniref:hypothetical protein n=1 Tax=Streptomyces sp. NPDC005476 TaxID=3156882 RepID=UPI0034564E27